MDRPLSRPRVAVRAATVVEEVRAIQRDADVWQTREATGRRGFVV